MDQLNRHTVFGSVNKVQILHFSSAENLDLHHETNTKGKLPAFVTILLCVCVFVCVCTLCAYSLQTEQNRNQKNVFK